MMGVAVEQMLDLWCTELRQVKAHLRALFPHPSVAASAAAFLDGLLGPERRKTGWMRAEAAGDPGPWCQQAVLGRSHGDADALRDLVREVARQRVADQPRRQHHREQPQHLRLSFSGRPEMVREAAATA